MSGNVEASEFVTVRFRAVQFAGHTLVTDITTSLDGTSDPRVIGGLLMALSSEFELLRAKAANDARLAHRGRPEARFS